MVAHPISHLELPATDRQAAARFYADLFGWRAEHSAALDYTMFDGAPGPGGAFVSIDGTNARAGEVLVYVDTDDIDATLARVGELGGGTILPKTEVPGVVSFAIFADPSGNRIGLSSDASGGAVPTSSQTSPHPIVFIEIPAAEPQAAAAFYAALFGWEARHDATLEYSGCTVGPAMGVGFPPIDGQQVLAGRVTIYAAADDIAATLDQAGRLGGRTLVSPFEIPTIGWIGIFADPSGTPIGLFKPMAR